MATPKNPTVPQLQALITSIPIHCANTVWSVAGQTFTATDAVSFLTAVLSSHTAVTAARAAWKAALVAEEKSLDGDAVVARELREAIGLQFSNSVSVLSAFAIVPRKVPKPLTGEALAARSAKANATRKARGTTSKKAKAAISGNVTGVTITPTTAPAASEPAVPAAVPASPVTTSSTTAGSASTAPGTGTTHS